MFATIDAAHEPGPVAWVSGMSAHSRRGPRRGANRRAFSNVPVNSTASCCAHGRISRWSANRLTGDGPHALDHVAVTYPTHNAWERQIAFLMAQGMRLSSARRSWRHPQLIHLNDPDGNGSKLVHQLPREAWKPTSKPH